MGVKAILDTNILVDYLRGEERARREIDRYRTPAISLITRMEILVGAQNEHERHLLREFLHRFECLPITQEVAELAVELRRTHRLRLPDAVIWATAQSRDALFVTRNTRDFPRDHPGVRVPYAL